MVELRNTGWAVSGSLYLKIPVGSLTILLQVNNTPFRLASVRVSYFYPLGQRRPTDAVSDSVGCLTNVAC